MQENMKKYLLVQTSNQNRNDLIDSIFKVTFAYVKRHEDIESME